MGLLIINADDWGRSVPETDAALKCAALGRVTSVTAMVFMSDSERAADLARQTSLPVGLHLNLNEPFASPRVSDRVRCSHQRVGRFLDRSRYSLLLYHPFLRSELKAVVQAQWDEFVRLYGQPPTHVDGHRHLHLCTNMLLAGTLPRGLKVRRSFSFWPGEKGGVNRAYRRFVNAWLRQRYVVTDYFFCLRQCQEQNRLPRVTALAGEASVELMTHPVVPGESNYLLGEEFSSRFAGIPMGSYLDL